MEHGMRKEEFYEVLDHWHSGIEVDPTISKAREREKIAQDTADFLAAGGKVEEVDPLAYGYKFEGFAYKLRLGGSLPPLEK